MAFMDSMMIEEQQQQEVNNRFRQKKGAWFDWLADEREAEDNGWDFGELQTKKGKKDDTVNWADPVAWQKPKATVSNAHLSEARPTTVTDPNPSEKADLGISVEEESSTIFTGETSEDAHSTASTQEVQDECSPARKFVAEMRTQCKKPAPQQEPTVECHKKGSRGAQGQRVVWCHEHCHKSHNDVRRKELWRLCRDHGASLVCHKKAAKFETWLGNTLQQNYILVTDWREAKPCMDIGIMKEKAMFTEMIVYCENEQTFKKATDWASSLPFEASRVYVASSVFDLDKLLLELLSKQSEEQSPTLATPTTTSDIGSDHGTDVETDVSDQTEFGVPMVAATVQFFPVCVPVIPVAPAVNPVFQILGPVLTSYTAQQLNEALEQASPDCYMD